MNKMITKRSFIALSLILALSACDDDDDFSNTKNPAWFAGDQTGKVANDVTTPIIGDLIISDVNAGEDKINPKTNEATSYGTFTISADGNWTYTLDTSNPSVVSLSGDEVLTDTIELTSIDGTPTTIVITIVNAGANVPAVFSGALSSTIDKSTDEAITGQINITDPDEDEEYVTEQTSTATTYGTFSIDNEALWTYTLDTSNSSVEALTDEDDFLTDSISISSIDGTTADIEITITGEDSEAPTTPSNTKAVAISDTQTIDAGELRYTHDSALSEGKLSASFLVESGKEKSAYIGIFGSSTSTSDAVVDLNIGKNSIKTRDEVVTDISYAQDEWINVEISWTQTNITLIIGDFTETYTPANNAGTYPIENIIFKLGDNSNVETASFLIDDFTLYADAAGSQEVFSDDFEGYDEGQSLDSHTNSGDLDEDGKVKTNDVEVDGAITTYNKSTNEAVIVSRGDSTEPSEPTEPVDVTDDFEAYQVGNIISKESEDWGTNNIKDNSDGLGTTTAEVSNGQAKSGTQSLFLQDLHSDSKPFAYRPFSAASSAGSVSFDAYIPSDNDKESFFMIGTGKDNADRYFELKVNGTKLQYEAGDEDPILVSDIELDTWHSINITWTDEGIITVTFNDEVLDDIKQSDTGLDASNIPTQLTFYVGNNASNNSSMYIDNLDSALFN